MKPLQKKEPLLTMKELARTLRCSPRSIQRQIKLGLPRIKVSKQLYRYDFNAVQAWFAMQSRNSEVLH